MQRRWLSNIKLSCLSVFLFGAILTAEAQPSSSSTLPGQQRLARTSEKVSKHIKTILGELDGAERKVKPVLEQARTDATAEKYQVNGQTIEGPERHPWLKASPKSGANPNWLNDYLKDSFQMLDGQKNVTQLWSCFEPQLIAKGWWPQTFEDGSKDKFHPASIDLALTCKFSCPDIPLIDNGYEVIQYWWPEHQVAVNNYGRSRVHPLIGGQTGAPYTRAALIAAKRSAPETLIKQSLKQNYPLPIELLKEPSREDPFIGQGMWGGTGLDTEERNFAHVYRTLYAQALSNRKPNSFLGWNVQPRSIYDSFAPPTSAKPITNTWTEYGAVEALSSVSSLSYFLGSRGQRSMNALYGANGEASEIAREDKPRWQRKGAAAYRIARWKNDFDELKEPFELNEDQNAVLREIVYKGGNELFPLALTLEGQGTPALAANAIFARRAFYLAGTRDIVPYLPGGEKSRMNEYTNSATEPGTEVDKMQLIYPTKTGFPSECFRSQRIPNLTDQTQDAWVKANIPHDLLGYVKQDYGDVAFAYWNKRVACTCRYAGIPHGAWAMDFPSDGFGPGRGTGDRPYGKIEKSLCTYQPKKVPSAFAGQDQEPCWKNPSTIYFKGIDDHV